MIGGGFAGKILHVDLTRREVREEPLDFSIAEDFIGGLGLTIKIAYDKIIPGTDALSPDNPIVIGAGPFVGTSLPATSRVFAVTKLPTSGTIGWCGGGGLTFGYLLKNAGYDNVVIDGRADTPVFLEITDDGVTIREADTLWGRGTKETASTLWDEFGRPLGVITIGQAGENLVRFSMAYIDQISTLGRGGFGAVMGSKNLKAITVRGSGGVRVADKKRYRAISEGFLKEIRDYPYLKEWQDLGLVKSFPVVPKETYLRIKKRRIACVSCPVGCKDLVEIPDGRFQGFVTSSSSMVNLYTPMIYGFGDYRDAIKFISTLDEYGLDMFEFFGVMKFAEELCRRGIIKKDRIESEIAVGSLESMEVWAKKVAYRDGLGDILAGGFVGILEEFGDGAMQYAPPLVKGMHPYAGPGSALPWDLFGTMELGQVLDPRGPHVGSGGSPTYFAKRPLDVFPRHLERMGVPIDAVTRIISGIESHEGGNGLSIGRLLKYSHNWFSILGSMGICARGQINRFYSASLCVELYEAVTGIKTNLEDLRKRVDRVWTLLKMANLREGKGMEDDALPTKWFEDPPFRDYLSGEPLSQKEAQSMIEDYYDEWGWDRKTGIPTQKLLNELGLANP